MLSSVVSNIIDPILTFTAEVEKWVKRILRMKKRTLGCVNSFHTDFVGATLGRPAKLSKYLNSNVYIASIEIFL